MNTYSETWIDTFLRSVPAARTDAEVAFLERLLPRRLFPRLLDVCCGEGRHAYRLAHAGYDVTAVDLDERLIAAAPRVSPDNPRYVAGDMRRVATLTPGPFDSALVLWQSFGGFDAGENDALLAGLAGALRPGGRLVLDLYHHDFFVAHQGTRSREHAGRTVQETKSMQDGRLTVRLDYEDGNGDAFSWELFTPDGLSARAAPAGLVTVTACRDFDERLEPSEREPRFQIVLERA